MKSNLPYSIHWFRRDLRIKGNPALQWSLKEYKGNVLGLFTFDSKFLSRSDFSHNRFGFFLKTLSALKNDLLSRGGDLLVLDESPKNSYEILFAELYKNKIDLPHSVSFNRDYEPFARARDQLISDLLSKSYGVNVHSERDHILIEPNEIRPYQVYSPFAKKWFEVFNESKVKDRINASLIDYESFNLTWRNLFNNKLPFQDHLDNYVKKNSTQITVKLPEAGSEIALKHLKEFKKKAISDYADNRDYPNISGTSKLSIYLKNGSITSADIIREISPTDLNFKSRDGITVFLKEIVWREFYYHILYHRPDVETQSFLPKYRNLKWENDETKFAAWKNGETGYPIVDAGMRQLNETGWMHNRVRMIVASFLTKDLLINWQWGEQYFMEKLLDGDLAPNNGGWQWAASTGCDPQPYFRIFNPTLQSIKFDNNGDYIKRFVPELKNLNSKAIHEPTAIERAGKYPLPIVDHSEQRKAALNLYDVENE